MKTIIVAAVALSMGVGVANAATYGGFPSPEYGRPWAAQQQARQSSSSAVKQQTSPAPVSKAVTGNAAPVAKGS